MRCIMSEFHDELAEAFALYSQLLDRAAGEAVWGFLTTRIQCLRISLKRSQMNYF